MDFRILPALLLLAAGPSDRDPGAPLVGFLDAATLSEACAASAVDARAICMGYIAGAADQLLAAQAGRGPAAQRICIPQGSRTATVVAVVATYAAWSHDAEGISAASFVEAVLQRAYPCQAETEPM